MYKSLIIDFSNILPFKNIDYTITAARYYTKLDIK